MNFFDTISLMTICFSDLAFLPYSSSSSLCMVLES